MPANPKPIRINLHGKGGCSTPAWEKQKKLCFERDGYTCQNVECLKSYPEDEHPLQPHHIKTKGSGGGDELENLITLCWKCHRLVHDGHIKII